jgi:hypothetical protein
LKDLIKKQTIIQNTKFLSHYDFEYIDPQVLKLLKNTKKELTESYSQRLNSLLFRFNCFLGLIDKKINILNFYNSKSITYICSNFLLFMKSYGFKESESITELNLCLFLKVYNILRKNNKNLKEILILSDFDYNILLDDKIKYFNGWVLKGKKSVFCNLQKYYNQEGAEKTNILYKRVKLFSESSDNINSSTVSRIVIFNSFMNFYHEEKKPLDDDLFYEFLKKYFIEAEEKGYCLNARKQFWNSFTRFAEYVFNLPENTILKVPETKVNGSETKIKIKNGKKIKSNLITEIPLEITDSEAIILLFKQINQDVSFVENWADYIINKTFIAFKNDNNKLKSNEFNLTVKSLARKRNFTTEPTLPQMIDTNGLVRNTFLLAVQFKLIIEHPEITESFLHECSLYDERDNIFCLRNSDNGNLLVSHKSRKGKKSAEQIISLNTESKRVLDILIELTQDMRDNLKSNNNQDWRKLFICLGGNNIKPFSPKKIIQEKTASPISFNNKKNYFIKYEGFSEEESINFSQKLTLTKMRASRAVQVYIKTESTTQMAKALGHKQYDPNLLSHYLPKPILDFFQNRWIRLFQKGIICEALKDSDFFLKASNLKTMDKLDEFLKNHALKNIPEINNINTDNNTNIDINTELYININEDIVSALLSIEKAVSNEINPSLINDKAIYWAKFSNALTTEIKSNNEHTSLRNIIKNAEKTINANNFNKVIYV